MNGWMDDVTYCIVYYNSLNGKYPITLGHLNIWSIDDGHL